jgi:outer membrane protein insertion porin family
MLFLNNVFWIGVVLRNYLGFWLCLIGLAVMCFFPTAPYARKKVSVTILPFEIYAREDLSYLELEISNVIKKFLEQEGAVVLVPPADADQTGKQKAANLNHVRQLGLAVGADYIIWGSMTWVGQRFSLDAKLLELFGDQTPGIFSIEDQGIENLPASVNALARDIGVKLFAKEKIVEIRIQGNDRIEVDAIKRVIKTAAGDIYYVKNLSEDLKAVYRMGYFDDVRIEAENVPPGKIIIFTVKEKQTIRRIMIKSSLTIFDEKDILDELTIRRGSILNINKIQNNIDRIESLYKEKNYHNVRADYEIVERDNNQADLIFRIEEGKKIRVKHILFSGNNAFKDKELKSKKVMKTREKGFFSWITGSGDLKREVLNEDVARITAFYHNQGYVRARIGEPKVEFKEDYIEITLKINEGPQFKVGKVDLEGDFLIPKEKLLEKLKIQKEEYYSRQIVRGDILLLTDLYADQGYAYADVSPRISEDSEQLIVNITYVIKKGKQVYFEEIIITGNRKTRDKVIRRQLRVYEQELFSGRRLKRSVRNLHRLDYFKDVKVNTAKGNADDKMILKIDVEEKSTGAFTFGGGYSNTEKLFIMASISQKNLFGRGQILDLRANWGDETRKYSINFVEPWLFDIPLSAGFKIYNWDSDFDEYEKDSVGGVLRLGYPIFDFTRLSVAFSRDVSQIEVILAGELPQSIQELVDEFGEEEDIITSSVTTNLSYDSRNRAFSPTEGQDHRLTVEYAGFGGDIQFVKSIGELGWYLPLVEGLTGLIHAKGGYGREGSGGVWPDYERFFLGGINSLRGFDEDDLSPKDENGNEIGGDKFVQFNFELIFPLIRNAGLDGVVFIDTGNVEAEDARLDLGGLRTSTGFEFRWNSPIGPIRLAYGYILDPQPTDQNRGQWEFSMGAAF